MSDPVNTRTYDAPRRRAAAERTRARVLRAARALFLAQGYDGTSVAAIARRARVSVDTVYTAVGRKPQLLLAVHDMELARAAQPVDAEDRDYVQAIRAAPDARSKIELYAAALADRLPRTVPLVEALRAAGATDPECRRVHRALDERRAANMARFAEELLATGELRTGLGVDDVATLVWSMNSPDYYRLVTSRGGTPDQYAELLTRVWIHSLLPDPVEEPG